MARKTSLWVAVAALGTAGSLYVQPAYARQEAIPMATPMGVTVQALGAPYLPDGLFRDGGGGRGRGLGMAYANAQGMTLYTYEKDTEANKSTCYDECAKAWPALAAPRNAKAFGHWTVVSRDDGGKQWAYKGKPLYTFAKDTVIGDALGVGGVAKSGTKGVNKASVAKSKPVTPGVTEVATAPAATATATDATAPGAEGPGEGEGATATKVSMPAPSGAPNPWRIAMYKPAEGITLPVGIAVEVLPDAGGPVYVDSRGLTLYVFDGDAKNDKKGCPPASCVSPWTPLQAAQIASPVADWTLISRDDGIQQWAFRGQPVYTYEKDLQPGDVYGVNVDKRWHMAMVEQYYRPAEAAVRDVPGRGKVLTAANGMTLYRREGHLFRTGGHGIPRTSPTSPAMGREVGTQGCNTECLKEWKPLKAPANAQSTGFWEVVVRHDDGSRQWSYKGYPMYTYVGDKKPGDVNGYDQYEILLKDGLHDHKYPIVPTINQFSLYWTYAYP